MVIIITTTCIIILLMLECNAFLLQQKVEVEESVEPEAAEPEAEDSPSDGEEAQEYVVEGIVGKRFDSSTMTYMYEIKWEGFPR